MALIPSIPMEEERHEGIAADGGAVSQAVQESTERGGQIFVVAQGVRLGQVPSDQTVEEQCGPAGNSGPAIDQKLLNEFIAPAKG